MSTMILVDFVRPLRRQPMEDRRRLALARILTVALGVTATLAGIFVSSVEGILKAINMVGGYTAAPVTALFLLGILSRRGRFRAWLASVVLVAIPLSVYVQHYSDVHWIFYGGVSMVSTLVVSYFFSRVLNLFAGEAPSRPELTLWYPLHWRRAQEPVSDP